MKKVQIIELFALMLVGIIVNQTDFAFAETIPEFASGTVVLLSGTTDVCHVPPGNPANAHTIVIGNSAIPAHISHGDEIIGKPCPENEINISEFSTAEVVTSSSTLEKAKGILKSIRMELDLSSGSKVGPAVSQAAQLHKWFAHEDKSIKKEFQMEFKQFIKDVKSILKGGQGVAEKDAINELEKTELKIKMQIEKDEKEEKIKDKIKTAIQLHDIKVELQNIKNQIAIEKLKFKNDNKELESLKEIELELLKQTLIFEAKSNNEKITPELIKSIEKKATEKVKENHNDNSGKGNSNNGKGNDKDNNKSNNGKGSDKKSDKSKGNSGKSKGKKK